LPPRAWCFEKEVPRTLPGVTRRENITMKIITFPAERARPPRTCFGCGIGISAAPRWHTRCRDCFRLEMFARALRRWAAR